jgi:hypothetical protein
MAYSSLPRSKTEARIRLSPYLITMAHESLASQLIWNCLTAKGITYAEERKVRDIIMNLTSKFDPWQREFNHRPYIEQELDPPRRDFGDDPIPKPGPKIWLGPCCARKAIQIFQWFARLVCCDVRNARVAR